MAEDGCKKNGRGPGKLDAHMQDKPSKNEACYRQGVADAYLAQHLSAHVRHLLQTIHGADVPVCGDLVRNGGQVALEVDAVHQALCEEREVLIAAGLDGLAAHIRRRVITMVNNVLAKMLQHEALPVLGNFAVGKRAVRCTMQICTQKATFSRHVWTNGPSRRQL